MSKSKAIVTFLASDDHLPGAQTCLYSLRHNLCSASSDDAAAVPEIEIAVAVTPRVSPECREVLCPTYCDRVIEVPYIPMPKDEAANDDGENNNNNSSNESSHVTAWDANCGLSKLSIFQMESYDKILYIDADCLVLQDVGHLLHDAQYDGGDDDKEANGVDKPVGLLAASPDIFPPDRFNAGVMLLRPSQSVLDDILHKANTYEITSYDGGDTGLLNAYYPDWFASTATPKRLSFGYNAQRFMYTCTYLKRPQYWEEGVRGRRHRSDNGDQSREDGLKILHYSSSPKPWEVANDQGDDQGNNDKTNKMSDVAKELLDTESAENLSQTTARSSASRQLDQLWQEWYARAKGHYEAKNALGDESEPLTAQKKNGGHKSVTQRYKELRKSGLGTADAMAQARKECESHCNGNGNHFSDSATMVGKVFGV